jgi:hypothetical protein
MLQNEPESSNPCVGINCPRDQVQQNRIRDEEANLLLDNVEEQAYQNFSELNSNRPQCILQNEPESSSPCVGVNCPRDQVQQDMTTEEAANLLWKELEELEDQFFSILCSNRPECMLQNEPENSSPDVGVNCPTDHVQQDQVQQDRTTVPLQGDVKKERPQEQMPGGDQRRTPRRARRRLKEGQESAAKNG